MTKFINAVDWVVAFMFAGLAVVLGLMGDYLNSSLCFISFAVGVYLAATNFSEKASNWILRRVISVRKVKNLAGG